MLIKIFVLNSSWRLMSLAPKRPSGKICISSRVFSTQVSFDPVVGLFWHCMQICISSRVFSTQVSRCIILPIRLASASTFRCVYAFYILCFLYIMFLLYLCTLGICLHIKLFFYVCMYIYTHYVYTHTNTHTHTHALPLPPHEVWLCAWVGWLRQNVKERVRERDREVLLTIKEVTEGR